MAEYKVLLTTSGIGSRLGELTNYTNKALIRVNNKPVISHIVEHYPKDVEFVVTLGYYGEQVKEFLEMVYPDRNFTFVQVDNYDGEGSSLGYSMLQARNELQCPFIFQACDGIIDKKLNGTWVMQKSNWVMSNRRTDFDQYRTIQKSGGDYIGRFKEKGEEVSGFGMDADVYVGVCGVYDYTYFWDTLEKLYIDHSKQRGLSDCHVINVMAKDDIKFRIVETGWYDIGNTTELLKTRKSMNTGFEILDKVDESIFMFEDFVIKFFYDETVTRDRVQRASLLPGTPKILDSGKHFFKYEKAVGNLFARSVTEPRFEKFLNWMKDNVWTEIKAQDFKTDCLRFYFDKTTKRITMYTAQTFVMPHKQKINGLDCLGVEEILDNIDKDWLSDGIPCNFHGDCILDNIIEYKDEFTLIDWRQNFNGKLYGDVYYDLAKLNHNLTFNHDLVNKGHYSQWTNDDGARVDILTSNRLQVCKQKLHQFIVDNGYDLNKVELLTAIIWINMAPLHLGKLGNFLMTFGQWHLNRVYKRIQNEQNTKKSSRNSQSV